MSTPIQKKIEQMVRDLTQVHPRPKSEVRAMLLELLAAIEEELEGKRRDGQWAGIISAQEDEVYNSALSDIKEVLELEEK